MNYCNVHLDSVWLANTHLDGFGSRGRPPLPVERRPNSLVCAYRLPAIQWSCSREAKKLIEQQ